MLGDVLLMVAVVFAVNVMPAFAPPTWIVLVYFRLRHDVPLVPLVVGGALASAAGRYVLATACRHLGSRLPERRRRDLAAVGTTLTGARGARWGLLALFTLSPLPSTQLFEAAGLTPQIRLVPVTLAFFCGRLVTYTIYVTGATLAKASLTSLLNDGFASPWSIALQVVLLGFLAAFVFTPWAKVLARFQPREPTGH
ncbi:MAG TPA: hypothetical protein VII98_05630 [Solirubrobacteraceae bacterium]